MVNKGLLGQASIKMKPDEYYRLAGKLLKKKKKNINQPPKEKVAYLANKLRNNRLEKYFKKCAKLGIDAVTAMNTVLSNIDARSCRYNDITTDPFITMATCILDRG